MRGLGVLAALLQAVGNRRQADAVAVQALLNALLQIFICPLTRFLGHDRRSSLCWTWQSAHRTRLAALMEERRKSRAALFRSASGRVRYLVGGKVSAVSQHLSRRGGMRRGGLGRGG